MATSKLKLVRGRQAAETSGLSPFGHVGLIPSVTIELADVWRALRRGTYQLVSSRGDPANLCLREVAEPRPQDERARSSLSLLEMAVVLGTKRAAIARSAAISTVVVQSAYAARLLGHDSTVSRLPLLAALAIVASQESLRIPVQARVDGELLLVKLPGLEADLRNMLPPRQFAVLWAYMAGLSYEAIAVDGGVSQRTVANQLAAVLRRLGVSSRNGLIQLLARTLAAGISLDERAREAESSLPEEGTSASQISDLRKRVQLLETEVAAMRTRLKESE